MKTQGMIEQQRFYAQSFARPLGQAGILLGLLVMGLSGRGTICLEIKDVVDCVYTWKKNGETDIAIPKGFFSITMNEVSELDQDGLVKLSTSIIKNWEAGIGNGKGY